MALVKPKLSSLVRSQLPEFVREDYQSFVSFLQAYYEYLETTQVDPQTLRDLDTTLDSFIKYFKDELAINLPNSNVDTKFLLQHMKEHYGAKGSEASFKLLFRILFNKEVALEYPSKQMLRASDGRWNQDVSVFAEILTGSPNDVVGKLVDIVTPNKIIRVLVDRRQDVEVEVDRAIRLSDTVYEFLIDRRFFGNISVGDRLRYRDDANGIYFTAEIKATTTSLEVQSKGSGFKVGDLYNIRNFDGFGSIMKVSRVDSDGGILGAQFIKFGVGYTTDFTTTISSYSGQDLAGTAGTSISRVGNNLSIGERLDGYSESGTINTTDYNLSTFTTLTGSLSVTNGSATVTGTGTSFTSQLEFGDYLTLNGVRYIVDSVVNNTTLEITETYNGSTSTLTSVVSERPPVLDGSYAGVTLREFGISNIDSQVTDNNPAIIKVSLGPLAKYPGYYTTNDGFLDDAIYIQDSHYYQAYSYVIKIDETLQSYKSIVKNLIHPAGMAMFGEYDIRNEFDVSLELESLIKILSLTFQDEQFINEVGNSDTLTRINPIFDMAKTIEENTLNWNLLPETHEVTPTTIGLALDGTRTMPWLLVNKEFIDTTLNYNGSAEGQYVTMVETGNASDLTRVNPKFTAVSGTLLSGSDAGFLKNIHSAHLDYDLNYDLESVNILDTSGSELTRTVPYLSVSKLLNENTYNYDGELDNNSVTIAELYYPMEIGNRTGLSVIDVQKVFNSVHLNGDGIVDNETVITTDGDAASPSDLNRTIPAFSLTTTFNTQYYIVGSATYEGNNNIVSTDSGGFLDINPYAEAGYFLNDGGLYVGNQIDFTG